MSLPLQSICIPAYNHERFVVACLEGVRQQTYPNLELLIVDDGSSDRTADMVEEFLAAHGDLFARTEFVRQPNQGLVRTCNRLLGMAKGKWLHFIASDDVAYPHKVQTQWQAFQDWGVPDVALVHGDMDLIDEQGEVIRQVIEGRPAPGPEHHAHERLLQRNYIYAPTAMVRRSALIEIGGYDETLPVEDFYTWLRLSKRYPIGRTPQIVCGYRVHGDNLSQRKHSMVQSLIETHHRFIGDNLEIMSAQSIKLCFRKDAQRVWRWVKKNRRGSLPKLAWKYLYSYFGVPTVDDFSFLSAALHGDCNNKP